MDGFTPTQSRILRVLADGKRHSKDELLSDGRADNDPDKQVMDVETLYVHICNIRKILNPRAEDIIVESYQRRPYYRWVRLLYPESRG